MSSRIVEHNVSFALIIEDDVDWNLPIKSQLRRFAQAVRLLIKPLPATTERFLDPSYSRSSSDQAHTDFYTDKYAVIEPRDSSYADLAQRDVLWVGHYGCRLPEAPDMNSPLAKIVLPNDTTVLSKHSLNMDFGNNELLTQYPART
jgi:hypothetical protein